RCLRIDPEFGMARNNRGNLLLKLGRLDEALACFDALLAESSDLAIAHYNRACVMARKRQVREAVRSLEQAIAREPGFLRDALNDPDFDAIRQRPTFKALLQRK
ncbi:MAG: tetratricopeptide repeat protein, partial [Deltaproteobacteria bacterium]